MGGLRSDFSLRADGGNKVPENPSYKIVGVLARMTKGCLSPAGIKEACLSDVYDRSAPGHAIWRIQGHRRRILERVFAIIHKFSGERTPCAAAFTHMADDSKMLCPVNVTSDMTFKRQLMTGRITRSIDASRRLVTMSDSGYMLPTPKLGWICSREACAYERRMVTTAKTYQIRTRKRFRRHLITARAHPTVFPTADIPIMLLSYGHQRCDDEQPGSKLEQMWRYRLYGERQGLSALGPAIEGSSSSIGSLVLRASPSTTTFFSCDTLYPTSPISLMSLCPRIRCDLTSFGRRSVEADHGPGELEGGMMGCSHFECDQGK
ncbi:hypothetical protein EV421DRAFT_1945484 [Armillaria borealis]|uniref:Uncharacterized protein n=1 Tax=Armillaria borealis TaxID=47425 RepID=A0AA39JKI5_9AGAR|nr:hypothetical protein EV421DRAFT_1945484 [Armillaria borealis]